MERVRREQEANSTSNGNDGLYFLQKGINVIDAKVLTHSNSLI